ncbi:MAG: MerR family transcriptional regulator [Chitinophagaceae bacterium]
MNHFTIRDIENLCGIKAHTLRTWEQRYKLFVAKRKQSMHRVYDNEDLKEMLRISFLYHQGHKISKIAALGPRQLHELVEKSCVLDCNHELFVHQLIEAGLDFDKEKFEKIVNGLVGRIGLEKCISEVFYPFLHRIGLLWMTNHVVPAQEHFVSHIIRKKIILATDGLEQSSQTSAPILLFTPEGEFHEIPLLVINFFFRKYNNRTVYFGANVSTDSLRYYMRQHPAGCLYMHVVTHLNNEGLNESINSLCSEFPIKLVLSGPAINCMAHQPSNLQVIHSLEELICFAKERGKTISA